MLFPLSLERRFPKTEIKKPWCHPLSSPVPKSKLQKHKGLLQGSTEKAFNLNTVLWTYSLQLISSSRIWKAQTIFVSSAPNSPGFFWIQKFWIILQMFPPPRCNWLRHLALLRVRLRKFLSSLTQHLIKYNHQQHCPTLLYAMKR